MRTQIHNIVNGCKEVIIDETHPKYNNAPKSTSHLGLAGTNHEVCTETFRKLVDENGDYLTIEVRSPFSDARLNFKLKKRTSYSGKTVTYACEITEDEFVCLQGDKTGLKKTRPNSPTFEINEWCQVAIKNIFYYRYIGSEFVTIK